MQVTDRATGQFVQTGIIRRLATAAPGSMGVSVTYVLRLGKTPLQYLVENYTTTLSTTAIMAPALAKVAQQLGAATGLPASTFTVAAPASALLLANAPFSITQPAAVVVAGAASSGNVGGAVGGAIAGIIALSCAIWSYRSYAKHGQLPCE